MILCVQSLRALLPAPPPKAPVGEVSIFHRDDGIAEPNILLDPLFPAPPLETPNTSLDSAPLLWDPTEDLRCLTLTFHQLHASGWYWGSISASEAQALLRDEPEGTFLVRDSCHPLYILTLSLKTAHGPTNVRIKYSHGQFHLDSTCQGKLYLPGFASVASLVQYYTGHRRCLGTDQLTAPSSLTLNVARVPLRLVRPLHVRQTCPTLQHLARLAINRAACSPARLPLPRPLVLYLQEYPFRF